MIFIGRSTTDGQTIEPFKLLTDIPTTDPDYVVPTTLSETRLNKLAASFGTLEKVQHALVDYTLLPK